MVSLAGLADGAAEKALSLLRGAGERRLTLFSDESPYGRRGRRVIARLARALGMRVRHRIFRTGGAAPGRLPRDALPIVAWLDRDGADALIRAARRAAYAGPILLGPAAAHPLLASVPGRKWPADRMRPPPGNPGEAILAVGHKLAVADALADGDPLKEKLERFRDVFLATFGRPPGVLSACAYDALLLLTESLYRVADPRAVRSMGARALPRVQARATFTGTLGTYRLTAAGGRLVWEGGLGESSYILLRARDGKWTPAGASGARLPAFRDPSFTPTRALPPSLKRLDGGSTTVPLNLRR
ncbi:MAG: hypothetical protein ACE5IM_01400, partial [Nitrospinota bacterium]